jgi:hypothetical protein
MAANSTSWIEAEDELSETTTGTEQIGVTEECEGGTGIFIDELPPRVFLSELPQSNQGGNNANVSNWLVGTAWDNSG